MFKIDMIRLRGADLKGEEDDKARLQTIVDAMNKEEEEAIEAGLLADLQFHVTEGGTVVSVLRYMIADAARGQVRPAYPDEVKRKLANAQRLRDRGALGMTP